MSKRSAYLSDLDILDRVIDEASIYIDNANVSKNLLKTFEKFVSQHKDGVNEAFLAEEELLDTKRELDIANLLISEHKAVVEMYRDMGLDRFYE